MAEKLDLLKQLGELYRPPSRMPVLVDVPELAFLTVDGAGDPSTSTEYASAVEALFAVSYTVKFVVKRDADGVDFRVMPLEGQWWSDDMTDFIKGRREAWKWTMMIAQPDVVTSGRIEEAMSEAGRKKDLPALGKVRFERFREGPCAQITHVGPFSDERSTIEALHAFIAEEGLAPRGKHHEIYLRDPRRTAPERLRTIIRQPVETRG